jgi:hypothetical protein
LGVERLLSLPAVAGEGFRSSALLTCRLCRLPDSSITITNMSMNAPFRASSFARLPHRFFIERWAYADI